MAPAPKLASSAFAKKRRAPSREQAFKQRQAKESSERLRKLQKAGKAPAAKKKTSAAPERNPHPFRYRSFNDRLAAVSIDRHRGLSKQHALAGLDPHGRAAAAGLAVGSISSGALDDDDEEADDDDDDSLHAATSFGIALNTWRELNLSTAFASFLRQAAPMSLSLPLLMHHRSKLSSMLSDLLLARSGTAYLAYEPALDLIPRLALDLGSEFLPCYAQLLHATLTASSVTKVDTASDEGLAATIVERSFESAAATLKCVAPLIVKADAKDKGKDWLAVTWEIVRPYLGWDAALVAGADGMEVDGDDGGAPGDDEQESDEDEDDDEGTPADEAEEEAPASKPSAPRARKVPAYTRRFASEALAHLVRKAKGTQLEHIADIMLEDVANALASVSRSRRSVDRLRAKDLAKGVAGVWVELAKSIEDRLHSQAPAQLRVILTSPSDAPQVAKARQLVGNLALTALVHHTGPSHLVPVVELIMDLLEPRLEAASSAESIPALEEAASFLSTLTGTRKGKRIDDSLKPRLFSLLVRLAKELQNHADLEALQGSRALVGLFAMSLPTGRLADLLGSGIKIVEALAPSKAAQAPSRTFSALVKALGSSSLAWDGFKQFVLPTVLKWSADASLVGVDASASDAALDLCATLCENGQLDHLRGQDTNPLSLRWKVNSRKAVEARLSLLAQRLEASEKTDALQRFVPAILLAPLFKQNGAELIEGLAKCAVLLRERYLIGEEAARSSYEASPVNGPALLGLLLEALAELLPKAAGKAKVSPSVEDLLSHQSSEKLLGTIAWHRTSLTALAKLYKAAIDSGITSAALQRPDDMAIQLLKGLTSADLTLRLAAAEMLELSERSHASAASAGHPSLFARIAEIERLPLTVEAMRDRNVRVRALARELLKYLANSSVPDAETKAPHVVVCYTISTFKLSLRPLWDEARKALVDLHARCSEEIWQRAFGELREELVADVVPSAWDAAGLEDDDGADSSASETDKAFDDPQYRERMAIVGRSLASSATQDLSAPFAHDLARRQTSGEKLNTLTYREQLLKLFVALPSIVEKHNAVFVPHFFDTVVRSGSSSADAALEEDSSRAPSDGLTLSERRARLYAYLEVFSKFSNPKALIRTEELHAFFLSLCATGDVKAQKLGLDCVLTWKDPAQMPYADGLRSLLEKGKFREQLLRFDLSEKGDAIQPTHRKGLLPLLIRILYGQIISKRGKGTSGAGQASRRTAILVALGNGCSSDELKTLVDLMLAPFEDQEPAFSQDGRFSVSSVAPLASSHRQSGYLSLLGEAIKHLASAVVPHWPRLIGVTLNLAHHASVAAQQGQGASTAVVRNIRQLALRRLSDFFKQPGAFFDWSRFLDAIFASLVSPRLAALPAENAQNPSALLQLFETWSLRTETATLLVSHDDEVLPQLFACLAVPTVKGPVIGLVIGIAERLAVFADAESDKAKEVQDRILRPFMHSLVVGLDPLLQRLSTAKRTDVARGDELLRRAIRLVAVTSCYVTSPEDATRILELLSPMLRKSNHVVPETSKAELLTAFKQLLLLSPRFQDPTSELFSAQLDVLSSALATMRGRTARSNLVALIGEFAKVDASLERVAGWLIDLESMSPKRIEEPDFDRRLGAFDQLNEAASQLSPREWAPLVNDVLFFVQDAEELAFRTNAGLALRSFVSLVGKEPFDAAKAPSQLPPLRSLLVRTVLPALRKSLRAKSELVRRELLAVIGLAVAEVRGVAALDEMHGLLADGDEEASFFNNIHHIQTHRRTRALRRLAEQADKGALQSRTIAGTFVPLVSHFLEPASPNASVDHGLVNETILCLGRLARRMDWAAYNSALWRFLRAANEAGTSQRVFVRTALAFLDAFHFNVDMEAGQGEAEDDDEDGEEAEAKEKAAETEEAALAVANGDTAAPPLDASKATTIVEAVTGRLLPALMGYLEQKDEAEDATRLPVAVGIVTVTKCLPSRLREIHIHKLIVSLCNVLKSKAQDTRDLARETFSKVAVSLGVSYLPKIVQQMRRTLTRGPQLSVLAFTTHTLLVHLMGQAVDPLTTLDAGLEDIVHVATEDVFGHTAEDRDSADYKGKIKEMRGSKSLDTFEQMAKVVRPSRLAAILQPLRAIMAETEAHRAVKAVEDCLRRVAAGVNSNTQFDAPTFLTLCHALISETSAFSRDSTTTTNKQGGKGKGRKGPLPGYQFAVLLKRKQVEEGGKRDHWARNSHRFVAFGLDLLVTAMRRARFAFSDADVMGRLDPLVECVGNTLYSEHAAVVALGLKASASLVKCPLPSLRRAMPVLIKQMVGTAQREGGAQSELAQTALKAVTTVLRERQDAEFKERQVTELLRLVVDDIEEPHVQNVLFGLLRAIISRRFVIAEVYDAMDKVAEMLVVSQSAQVREVSRATFLQFLLDYPQGKGRLRNQVQFLVKNLSYVYESGRLSVLELLDAICSKFAEDVVEQYADLFFVGLVMALANDDSPKCREKAASLLKKLVGVVAEERRARFVALTHSWAEQEEKPPLRAVALQVYALTLEAEKSAGQTGAPSWIDRALDAASAALSSSIQELEEIQASEMTLAMLQQMGQEPDWRLAYHALQLVTKMLATDAAVVQARNDLRLAARELLLYPHAWTRLASGRLLGAIFASSSVAAPSLLDADDDDEEQALQELLSLDSLVETSKRLCLQLRTDPLTEELSTQVIKNLLYVGRCFALVTPAEEGGASSKRKAANASETEEDEKEDDEDDSDDEEGAGQDDVDDDEARSKTRENPLAWLFTKLSYLARSVQLGRADAEPNTALPAAVLKWFAAMSSQLEAERLKSFLPHIIGPILRITDDEALKGAQLEELKTLATEVQEHVSDLVGPATFAAAYSSRRAKVQQKRRERKTARLMQGIRDPEGAARVRAKRNERKHDSRKRKSNAFADRKQRVKPLKRFKS